MRSYVHGVNRLWAVRGFTMLTLFWLGLLVTMPLVATHAYGDVAALSDVVYFVGSFVCHQQPDRSFHIDGGQMPVCARCSGLYLGAGIGVVLAGLRARTLRQVSRQASPVLRWVVLAAAVPMGLSVVAEVVGAVPSGGVLRAASAVPLGVAVTWVVSLVIRGELA